MKFKYITNNKLHVHYAGRMLNTTLFSGNHTNTIVERQHYSVELVQPSVVLLMFEFNKKKRSVSGVLV